MTLTSGSQTLVASTIGSLSTEGRMVALADGGWVVIWSARETSGMYDVKLQVYDADGAAIGGSITANSTTSSNQYQPEATALSGGGFVVTWNAPGGDGDQSGIFQQAFNADGTRLGDEEGVNTYTSSHQISQSVAPLSDGGWVVTWQSTGQDGSGAGIYQQIYTAEGEKSGSETRVNSTTADYQGLPSAAALANGGWVVAWESYGQDGSQKGIYQQAYDSNGAAAGSEVLVNTYTTGQQTSPSVTALADGGWVVTWQSSAQDGSGEGVYQQAYDADGTARGEETQVNTQTTYDQNASQTTALAGGGWVVSWVSSDGGGNGIYQQVFDASGEAVGDETLVNTHTVDTQNEQRMTALAGGGWVVTWQNLAMDYNTMRMTTTVYQRVFNADGTAYGDEMLVTETSNGDDRGPKVTALADGGWVISWETGTTVVQRQFTLNDAPQVNEEIADQTASEDAAFSFQIASDAFTDDGDSLTYTATLADGDDLPSWLTFDAATRTFSGTPGNDDDGLLEVKVTATDRYGESVSDTFEIEVSAVNDAPTVENSIADQSAAEDVAFSFTFAASTFGDIDAGDSLTYTATLANGDDLPSWLTFDAATRTFSGTPGNDDDGLLLVKVTATDGDGESVSDTFEIDVSATNDAPTVVNSISDQMATEDEAFSFTFAASTFGDIDAGDSLSYTATLANGDDLPSWLVFNAATRTFSGTPGNDDDGLISVKVTATDSNGASVSDTFKIDVSATNDAPTVENSIADQSAAEDETFSFTFAASTFGDIDAGDSLTYTATLADGDDLPSWLVFDAATRTFSGTPGNDDAGLLEVKVTATDGDGESVSDTFEIDVSATNDAPTVENSIADQSAAEDETFSFTFAASTFGDIDAGDSLTYTATLADGDELPSWLIFDAATRTFSGIPDNGAVGTVSVKVTATDSSAAEVSDTFNITVANTSDRPTSSDSLVSTGEDTAYSLSAADFDFADVDGDTMAGIVVETLGSGTLLLDGAVVTADQEIAVADLEKLVWTPDADANGDAITAFTFKVKDSTGATSVAAHAFAVDVTAINDDPLATDDTAALTEGKTTTVNVLANDTDIEGDTLSLDAATVTSGNGTITFDADGTMVVTYAGGDLDKGATTEIVINYDMSDGVGGSASGTLTVTVTGVAEPGDPIVGGKGDDTLVGTKVAETITGGKGDDTILGKNGDDVLRGGEGDDILKGNGGNDRLSAGSGDDVLNGGDGDDILEGWSDNDRLTGGSGADTFVFHTGDGKDIITDFETNGKNHDLIDLSSLSRFSSFRDVKEAMRETGNGVVIEYGANSITLQRIDIDELSREHFVL